MSDTSAFDRERKHPVPDDPVRRDDDDVDVPPVPPNTDIAGLSVPSRPLPDFYANPNRDDRPPEGRLSSRHSGTAALSSRTLRRVVASERRRDERRKRRRDIRERNIRETIERNRNRTDG